MPTCSFALLTTPIAPHVSIIVFAADATNPPLGAHNTGIMMGRRTSNQSNATAIDTHSVWQIVVKQSEASGMGGVVKAYRTDTDLQPNVVRTPVHSILLAF